MNGARRRVFTCGILIALTIPMWAELPGPPQLKIPRIGGSKDESPVTTSLKDADTEVSMLDRFSPREFLPMDALFYRPGHGFLLFPGMFAAELQSYCLHAGAYGPTRGDGYLYAPLMGPQAGPIHNILKNSVRRPEIPQDLIQTLIWAILARADPENLEEEERQAAGKLLSRQELSALSRAAQPPLTEDALGQLYGRLPAAVRELLEVENALREKFAGGPVSYEELEEIAIKTGDHAPGPGSREVPAGRWSYDRGGFFIRFFPSSYSQTRVEVSVPRPCALSRDAQGRPARLDDQFGHVIECSYGSASLQVPGDSGVTGFALEEVRFASSRTPGAPEESVVWQNVGWLLVGVPNGKGRLGADIPGFTAARTRYKEASQQAAEIDRLLRAVAPSKQQPGDVPLRDLVDLQELRRVLSGVRGDNTDEALFLLDTAWQDAFVRAVHDVSRAQRQATGDGEYTPIPALIHFSGAQQAGPFVTPLRSLLTPPWIAQSGGGSAGSPQAGGVPFDPAGIVGTPADTSTQRLAQSARPQRPPLSEEEEAIKEGLKRAFGVDDDHIQVSERGGLEQFAVILGSGNRPLPSMDATQQAIGAGNVAEGSLEAGDTLLVGSVQQVGDETQVVTRTVDVETGTVEAAGRGSADGTDAGATAQAAQDALKDAGITLGPPVPFKMAPMPHLPRSDGPRHRRMHCGTMRTTPSTPMLSTPLRRPGIRNDPYVHGWARMSTAVINHDPGQSRSSAANDRRSERSPYRPR